VHQVESFRNFDGVVFKLQNLHNVAAGKGSNLIEVVQRPRLQTPGLQKNQIKKTAKTTHWRFVGHF
jgi:hypothetical protein